MYQEPFDDAQSFKLATDHESIPSVYGSLVVLIFVTFQLQFKLRVWRGGGGVHLSVVG